MVGAESAVRPFQVGFRRRFDGGRPRLKKVAGNEQLVGVKQPLHALVVREKCGPDFATLVGVAQQLIDGVVPVTESKTTCALPAGDALEAAFASMFLGVSLAATFFTGLGDCEFIRMPTGRFYLPATSLARMYVTSNAFVRRSSCTEAGRQKRPISYR